MTSSRTTRPTSITRTTRTARATTRTMRTDCCKLSLTRFKPTQASQDFQDMQNGVRVPRGTLNAPRTTRPTRTTRNPITINTTWNSRTTKTIQILGSNRAATTTTITCRITLSDTPKAAASGVGLPSHVLFRRVGRHPAQVLHRHWPACWPAKLHNRRVVLCCWVGLSENICFVAVPRRRCLLNFLKILDLLDFYK